MVVEIVKVFVMRDDDEISVEVVLYFWNILKEKKLI